MSLRLPLRWRSYMADFCVQNWKKPPDSSLWEVISALNILGVQSPVFVSTITLGKMNCLCFSFLYHKMKRGLDNSIFKALFYNKWMILFYFKQKVAQISFTPVWGGVNPSKMTVIKKVANNYWAFTVNQVLL